MLRGPNPTTPLSDYYVAQDINSPTDVIELLLLSEFLLIYVTNLLYKNVVKADINYIAFVTDLRHLSFVIS